MYDIQKAVLLQTLTANVCAWESCACMCVCSWERQREREMVNSFVICSLQFFVRSGVHECIHSISTAHAAWAHCSAMSEAVALCVCISIRTTNSQSYWKQQGIRVHPANPLWWTPVIGLKMSQERNTVAPGGSLCWFSPLFACVSHRDVLSAVCTALANVLCVPAANCGSLVNFCHPLTYCIVTSELQGECGWGHFSFFCWTWKRRLLCQF